MVMELMTNCQKAKREEAALRQVTVNQANEIYQLTKQINDLKHKLSKNEPLLKQARMNNQLLKQAVQSKLGKHVDQSDTLDELLRNISSEESPATQELKAENKQIIDQKFGIVKIDFKPKQQLRTNQRVSILGEFNQWMPEVMQRYKQTQIDENPDLENTFYYRVRILKGYSYRYHFCVNDSFVVDETKPSSQARFGQLTNWVQCKTEEDLDEANLIKKPSYYNLDRTEGELEEQQMQRLISKQSDGDDIAQLLNKFDQVQDEVSVMRQLHNEARAIGDEKTRMQIEVGLECLTTDLQRIVEAVRIQVVGRIVRTNALDDLYFEVQDFNQSSSVITLRKLFDQNGILLSQNNQEQSNFKRIRGSVLSKHYEFLDLTEENQMRQKIFQESRCQVKYQVIMLDNSPQCIPMEIKPSKLSFDDYEVKMSDDGLSISQVISKQAGAIEFIGLQVDEQTGFVVDRSVKVHTCTVMAGEVELLNVISVEFTDTEILDNYEIICLEDGQSASDFLQFGNNPSGSPLRYRILVQDQLVKSVLYNSSGSVDQIQFEEMRWKVGDQAKVINHRVGSQPIHNIFTGRPVILM